MKRDLPCSRCGTLMYRSPQSRPAGEAVCRPCRREKPAPYGTKKPPAPLVVKTCRDCGSETDRGANQNGRLCEECAEKARNRSNWTAFNQTVSLEVLADHDYYQCALCNDFVDMDLPHTDPMSATRDHVIPQSRGGSHDRDNLRLVHRACNSARGNRKGGASEVPGPIENEFRTYVESLGESIEDEGTLAALGCAIASLIDSNEDTRQLAALSREFRSVLALIKASHTGGGDGEWDDMASAD